MTTPTPPQPPSTNMTETQASAPSQRVVGVRMRPAGRIYYYLPGSLNLKTGQWVIIETTKGTECARVVIAPREMPLAELGSGDLKPVQRVADENDLRLMLKYKAREKEALRRCAARVAQHGLAMKLAEAEYTYDGSRLTFYFTAEDRVDFRALVRDLAAHFRTRIELRQIGARDHAKLLGGVGVCGKTLCCSSWLTEFNVVSIRMAKEQGLPLNTSKISGVCGRLMCCLAYENDLYVEARARMPEQGMVVTTPSGTGRVIGINVPRDAVEVMLESGVTITVPVREVEGYEDRTPPEREAVSPGSGGCGKPNCRKGQHMRQAHGQAPAPHEADPRD